MNEMMMHAPLLKRLVVSGGFVVAGWTGTLCAHPQAGEEQQPDAAPQAQQASGITGLEEVVVTARFREQSAQDLGQSISVLSADKMARQGITDIADIVRATPGLDLIGRGPGRNQPSIRGMSSAQPPSDILQQSSLISQFLDEVPTTGPTQNQPDLPLYDLDRVEVLKGPQPTYFGEGSVGGSVRYFMKNPSLDIPELRTRAEISNTEGSDSLNYIADGSVGIPIITDKLGVRLTAYRRSDAGFIDNATTGHSDVNDSDATGATAVLLAKPTDDLTLRFSAIYQQANINFDRIVSEPLQDLTQGAPGILPFPGPKSADDRLLLLSGKVSYVVGPVTVEGVAGYYNRRFEQRLIDRTQSFIIFPQVFGLPATDSLASNNQEDDNFTGELRVITDFDSPLNFVGGVFYADTRNTTAQEQRSAAFIPATGDDFYFDAVIDISGEQLSVFGEAQLALLDERLRFAGGARRFSQDFETPIVGAIKLPVGPGAIALFSLPDLLGGPDAKFRNSIDETLLRGQVEFDVSDDVLVFASVSEGARNGLFNSPANIALGGLSQQQFATYAPDSVLAYEVGLKSMLLDNRLLLNVSLFENQWDDIQIPFTVPSGVAVVANGPKAVSRGVELEASFRASDALMVFGNASHTDAKFDGATVLALGGATGSTLTADDRIPNVPDWKINLGVEGRAQGAFKFGDLVGSVVYQHVGDAVATATEQEPIDGYSLVNARLGVENDRWSAYLFADNVFNEVTTVFLGTPGLGENYINRPRTVGLTFRMSY